MQQVRLYCSLFDVDVRLREFNGRWLASADTPEGPSLGWGMSAVGALWMALEPFEGVIEELLASASNELAARP
ncbi:MAG: hypothetical protein ACRDE9_02875 [Candidatus Limnocylindria bacterium]